MVTAWVLRDFAKPLLEKIPCEYPKGCAFPQLSSLSRLSLPCKHKHASLAGIIRDYTGDLDDKFFGQQAVYRVSMGSFVSRSHWVDASTCLDMTTYMALLG